MMDFVSTMMDFVLKMMDFAEKEFGEGISNLEMSIGSTIAGLC